MGSGTNPIQWRHDDVITDFRVRWLRNKNLVYMFTTIFDPFRVEIGEIWPQTPLKRITSAFRRAWPHALFDRSYLASYHDNSIVSHPIVTKFNMNDDMGSVTNRIWWRHDDVISHRSRLTDFRWKRPILSCRIGNSTNGFLPAWCLRPLYHVAIVFLWSYWWILTKLGI